MLALAAASGQESHCLFQIFHYWEYHFYQWCDLMHKSLPSVPNHVSPFGHESKASRTQPASPRQSLRVTWEIWMNLLMSSESERRSAVSDSLWPHGLYSSWNSPGQNTGVGSLSLLQGIFPNQGSNPGFPHCRWIFYQLSHKGIPRILEWVAFPFSRGSSQTRNQPRVSCTAGGFFTKLSGKPSVILLVVVV